MGMSLEMTSGVIKIASIFKLSPSANGIRSSIFISVTPNDLSRLLLVSDFITTICFFAPLGNGNYF